MMRGLFSAKAAEPVLGFVDQFSDAGIIHGINTAEKRALLSCLGRGYGKDAEKKRYG